MHDAHAELLQRFDEIAARLDRLEETSIPHSDIGLMTPAAVHHAQAKTLHSTRERVLTAAYAA